MAKPKVWIRTADGEVKHIPKRNWQTWKGRGAVRIEDPQAAPAGVEQPVHIGGGHYRMPDGSTVRGREAAGLKDED